MNVSGDPKRVSVGDGHKPRLGCDPDRKEHSASACRQPSDASLEGADDVVVALPPEVCVGLWRCKANGCDSTALYCLEACGMILASPGRSDTHNAAPVEQLFSAFQRLARFFGGSSFGLFVFYKGNANGGEKWHPLKPISGDERARHEALAAKPQRVERKRHDERFKNTDVPVWTPHHEMRLL